MSVYETMNLYDYLAQNEYPGRGIAVGLTPNSNKAVFAYFIMGRSANSRNRIFKEEGNDITIYPFDASKVEDPSLIIYSPVKVLGDKTIVTNGDQTDTIYNFLKVGKSFEDALNTRHFEPDAPNFTPRISAMLNFENEYSYQMSILKSADAEGTNCNRYYFNYSAINGVGHFISTYNSDGKPLPSFTGEPKRISVDNDIDVFANNIWENLNQSNKVSLVVRYIELKTGKFENRVFNANK